jgi:hypothetical protein
MGFSATNENNNSVQDGFYSSGDPDFYGDFSSFYLMR